MDQTEFADLPLEIPHVTNRDLTFPLQLDRVRDCVLAQAEKLRAVAELFAAAIASGGVVHVYANGHSRMALEELCVRMGALTGFHPILSAHLSTFTDVVGASGICVAQAVERVEGLGAALLDEVVVDHIGGASDSDQDPYEVCLCRLNGLHLFYKKHYPVEGIIRLARRDERRARYRRLCYGFVKFFQPSHSRVNQKYRSYQAIEEGSRKLLEQLATVV